MLLITHITIALLSIIQTAVVYVRPTRTRFQMTYAFVGLTLASGVYLVASTHAKLASSCMTGIVYLSIVSVGIFFARKRLNAQQSSISK